MISEKFIDSLGIEADKAQTLKDAIKKDSFYRNILYKLGIMPGAIEAIMRTVDLAEIDLSQEDVLTEKARVEWADLIPSNKNKN